MDGRTDVQTLWVKIAITAGRDCGWALWIIKGKEYITFPFIYMYNRLTGMFFRCLCLQYVNLVILWQTVAGFW